MSPRVTVPFGGMRRRRFASARRHWRSSERARAQDAASGRMADLPLPIADSDRRPLQWMDVGTRTDDD